MGCRQANTPLSSHSCPSENFPMREHIKPFQIAYENDKEDFGA